MNSRSILPAAYCSLLLVLAGTAFSLAEESAPVSSITSNGVTWTFAEPVEHGTYITGDPWVIGPVEVIGISNDLNDKDFTPRRGQNGSMVNPLSAGQERSKQGYDDGLGSYDESLNASLPNGAPVSADNPLKLSANSSLISMVSWLYRDKDDAEPGTPSFNGGTKAPRPTTRSAGVLTVLDAAPAPESFRPPYAGSEKKLLFTKADLHLDKLASLAPPNATVPDMASLTKALEKPWIDHAFEFMGAMIHPSEHMPNYGRDMGNVIGDASLVLNLDASALPGQPDKTKLAIAFVQFGIDLTGIADAGGGWRANGGHALGRKWPILMAGILLQNEHMMQVGDWPREFDEGVEFQEDQNHFYVTQVEVDLTQSSHWSPDHRNVKKEQADPYEAGDIGLPEWGIRHAYKPQSDNKHMEAVYRSINGGVTPSFALAAHIMHAEKLWNHPAFFDYNDRYMAITAGDSKGGTNAVSKFVRAMWDQYRSDYPPVWTQESLKVK